MKTGNQQSGYTLIEVLLVTAVTLLIASASVVSFAPLMQQATFEEGVNRFESLLRFARAEAANSGHKIQIQFESASLTNSTQGGFKPVIVIELDPFDAPGQFATKPELSWMNEHVYDLVLVESVRSLDPPEPALEETSLPGYREDLLAAREAASPASITFYPDGSSDSAEFVIASTDPSDARRMRVRLIGLTGEISRQLVSSDPEFELEGEPMDDALLLE